MPQEKILQCWSCSTEIKISGRVTRDDACPQCDNPIKCCYNCRFYDKTANHHCTEPQAEWVRYKEKANFCEYFEPRPPVVETPEGEAPKESLPFSLKAAARNRHRTANQKERTKEAWDDLFKD